MAWPGLDQSADEMSKLGRLKAGRVSLGDVRRAWTEQQLDHLLGQTRDQLLEDARSIRALQKSAIGKSITNADARHMSRIFHQVVAEHLI